MLCHPCTPLECFPTYSREQECFLQPEQLTPPPPPPNHKINKNAVKFQKRLFEVCRLFSELQKIFFLFQIASWSNQCGGSVTEYTAYTDMQLRVEHIIFLTWQVSTTMSWRPTLINNFTVIVIKVERLMRRALIKICCVRGSFYYVQM